MSDATARGLCFYCLGITMGCACFAVFDLAHGEPLIAAADVMLAWLAWRLALMVSRSFHRRRRGA